MRSRHVAFFAVALFGIACGARTNLPGEDELDASFLDVIELDSTVLDVTPPPPPPPDDAQPPPPPPPPPPPDDAAPPPPDDAGPPPPPVCNVSCKHNHKCEVDCPSLLPPDRWCCDEQVDTCYAFTGKHCPQTIFDAGFD